MSTRCNAIELLPCDWLMSYLCQGANNKRASTLTSHRTALPGVRDVLGSCLLPVRATARGLAALMKFAATLTGGAKREQGDRPTDDTDGMSQGGQASRATRPSCSGGGGIDRWWLWVLTTHGGDQSCGTAGRRQPGRRK